MASPSVENLDVYVAKMLSLMEIKEYKLDLEGNTIKGDNYLGDITFLKVYTTKNKTKQDYDLVIKSAKQSKELRKQTPIKEAFDRESLFYSKIWPALNNLQKEKQVRNPFNSLSKCYYISQELNKEAIILQNLKSLGFELHDRKQAMNLDHVLMVVKNYGKFHALSIAFRDQKPQLFESLTKNLSDVLGEFFHRMDIIDLYVTEFNKFKKILKVDGKIQILKKFDGFENEFLKVVNNYTNGDSQISCFIHGDCWNNNFMFKYENGNKNKPVDMRFLDFQLSRVGSPILDLSYFLYCCGDQQIFDNFDLILQTYYSSLTEFLNELGCDAKVGFSLKTLKESWKDHAKFGAVLALQLLKLSLCESNQAPDMTAAAENGEDFTECLNVAVPDKNLYNERLKNVYLHLAEFLP